VLVLSKTVLWFGADDEVRANLRLVGGGVFFLSWTSKSSNSFAGLSGSHDYCVYDRQMIRQRTRHIQ
jgi:hypothetical protein